jgi:ubiquinone/menaquinone biosynthesis C-methylase UbiE
VSFYDRRILPHVIHAAMRQDILTPYRARLAAAAEGRVLEIGIGSGLNLPFCPGITRLIGLDPSPRLLSLARRAAARVRFAVDLVEGSAGSIPLAPASVDTVVTSWALCSVPDAGRALQEMRRVLTSSGRLLFVEHGRSPDAGVVRVQDALTPI